MKFSRLTPAAILLGFAIVIAAPAWADPDEKKPKSPEARKSHHGGGEDPFAGLSPEERQQFREAMRRAWSDPAVLQARDEVKAATVAYQKALSQAVGRIDPRVIAIMEKIRETSDSSEKGIFTGPPGGRGPGKGPGGGSREFFDIESFLSGGDPGHFAKLSDEQKEIYRAAREKAVQSAPFQDVLGKLREMRVSDEALRKKRIDIFRRARQVFTAQMIEADERVKEFLPKRPPQSDKHRGPGPDGKPRPDQEKQKAGDPKPGKEKDGE